MLLARRCGVVLGRQRLDGGPGLRRARALRAALAMRSLPLAFSTVPAPPAIPPPTSAFALAVLRGDGLALRDRRDGRIGGAHFLRSSFARFLGRSLLALLRRALLARRPLALLLPTFASVTV